jgi:hypothetical protein
MAWFLNCTTCLTRIQTSTYVMYDRRHLTAAHRAYFHARRSGGERRPVPRAETAKPCARARVHGAKRRAALEGANVSHTDANNIWQFTTGPRSLPHGTKHVDNRKRHNDTPQRARARMARGVGQPSMHFMGERFGSGAHANRPPHVPLAGNHRKRPKHPTGNARIPKL